MSRVFDPAAALQDFLAKNDMTVKSAPVAPAKLSEQNVISAAKAAAADLRSTVQDKLTLRAEKVAIVRHMFRTAARLA